MYLTTREACDRLRISRWTLRRRIAAGEIDAHKGPFRTSGLKIDLASVAAYEQRYAVAAEVAS
jgi:excisionase family DNA binding protein